MTHQIIRTIESASDKKMALIYAEYSFDELLWFGDTFDYYMMFDKPSEYDFMGDKRYGKIGEGTAEIKPETAKKILNAVKSGKKIETKSINNHSSFLHSINLCHFAYIV